MLTFHAYIHDAADQIGLSVGFEEAAAALGRLPRLFLEPDGSFVMRETAEDGVPWQVDGNLVDQGERLAYVEIRGQCPHEVLDKLLGACGWPDAQLAFQLVRRGVTLSEAEFRTAAARPEGAV